MPVPAALDADPTRPPIPHGRHLRRTAVAVTGWIRKPRGVALSPSAAPLTRFVAGAACCCPCSVELPGEAA